MYTYPRYYKIEAPVHPDALIMPDYMDELPTRASSPLFPLEFEEEKYAEPERGRMISGKLEKKCTTGGQRLWFCTVRVNPCYHARFHVSWRGFALGGRFPSTGSKSNNEYSVKHTLELQALCPRGRNAVTVCALPPVERTSWVPHRTFGMKKCYIG